MQKFRFHVVSLPHTQVTKEYLPCAYTQKIRNFCLMMKSLGHEVFLYASEDTDIEVDELVTCITKEEQKKHFGHNDWKKEFFDISWDYNLPYWKVMNETAAKEIKKRAKKEDFVCLIGGWCQKPIADALPELMNVEIGIGYKGTFSNFKVFESYAWMHHVYGLQQIENGNNYDCVIPNYFDPNDFQLYPKEDYYLFIGRMVQRKGPHIAVEAVKRVGGKLIMAGQGVTEKVGDRIKSKELEVWGDHIEHIGTVNAEQRKELMGKAKAVIVQTQYIGPFEGVAVEAMMAGTPIITTDWGCFSEYNHDGITGFRTRTLGEVVQALKNVDKLDPKQIRDYAINNFSMDRVKYLYQAYFEQLSQLWGEGWYSDIDNAEYKRYQLNRI